MIVSMFTNSFKALFSLKLCFIQCTVNCDWCVGGNGMLCFNYFFKYKCLPLARLTLSARHFPPGSEFSWVPTSQPSSGIQPHLEYLAFSLFFKSGRGFNNVSKVCEKIFLNIVWLVIFLSY